MKLDFLALGDWHGRKQVDARTWYSGTHEPERFRDNDPGPRGCGWQEGRNWRS